MGSRQGKVLTPSVSEISRLCGTDEHLLWKGIDGPDSCISVWMHWRSVVRIRSLASCSRFWLTKSSLVARLSPHTPCDEPHALTVFSQTCFRGRHTFSQSLACCRVERAGCFSCFVYCFISGELPDVITAVLISTGLRVAVPMQALQLPG